eukprot:snap_masked-scaffold_5-processed-gene-1.40-mRNA-1 protein AED:1.00 eAED:1.00 QI:0/-1/0/0/-1/1/1/0/467
MPDQLAVKNNKPVFNETSNTSKTSISDNSSQKNDVTTETQGWEVEEDAEALKLIGSSELEKADENDEEELEAIRKLLTAEKTGDAFNLLDAQGNFLRSSFTAGMAINESVKVDPEEIQKIKQQLKNFQTVTGAEMFDEDTFMYPTECKDSSNEMTSGAKSKVDKEFSTIIKIPLENDEQEIEIDVAKSFIPFSYIPKIFGSFEENQILNLFLAQIEPEFYSKINKLDKSFRGEFNFYCLLCLRCKQYCITKALALLSRYVLWRKREAFFLRLEKENRNELKCFQRQVELLETSCIYYVEEAYSKVNEGIVVIRMKQLYDFEKNNAKSTPEELVLLLNNVLIAALKSNETIQQHGFLVIFDFNGINSQRIDMGVFDLVVKCMSMTFPVKLERIIVYHPPLYFRTVKKWYNLFLKDRQKAKMISVYKHKTTPECRDLFHYVTQDQLPSFYCGARHVSIDRYREFVLSDL